MASPNFEKDLERLETLVTALEEGGLSLDAALKHFEEGIRLAQRCDKALADAEKRIEILMKNADGELEAQPFVQGEEPAKAAPRRVKERAPAADTGAPEPESEDADELLF